MGYGPKGNFNPKPCRACHGISKSKCMFCGQSFKMKKFVMTDWEKVQYDSHVAKIEYLKTLYGKLKALRMQKMSASDVLAGLENEILLWIGDWRN